MNTLKWSNGDIVIGVATGRPRYISGIEKTSQDVAHAFLTEYDPVRGRGSELLQFENKVKGTAVVPAAQSGFVRRFAEEAIRRLMTHQQEKRNLVSDDEFIVAIERIDTYAGDSPTDLFFYAVVTTMGGEEIPLAFRINLAHQLPDYARAFLPGISDDFRADT